MFRLSCNDSFSDMFPRILPQVYNTQIRANSQVVRSISKHQADMRTQRVNSRLPGRSKLIAAVLITS